MPRQQEITPTASPEEDAGREIIVYRDERMELTVKNEAGPLSLTIGETEGGAYLVEIPSTNGTINIWPEYVSGLKENQAYYANIWDVADPDDPKLLAKRKFRTRNTINPDYTAFPVQVIDGQRTVTLTAAEYEDLSIKDITVEYRILGNVITAEVSPSLAALDNSQTPADGLSIGSYSSLVGDIVSATPTYYMNGLEKTSDVPLSISDTVLAAVLATDEKGNSRAFFTNSVTVSDAGLSAPTWTTQPSIAPASAIGGSTFTLNEGIAEGSDSIVVEYFTFNGEDVSGDLNGLEYTAPDGLTEDGVLRVQFRAVNAQGPTLSAEATADVTADAYLADYVVTSDAEWDAVFANDAATLDGKVMEVSGSNFTPRTISEKDFPTGFKVRSADVNSTIPHLELDGTVSYIHLDGLNFQMTGWPGVKKSVIHWGTGIYKEPKITNCKIRHGYGTELADMQTDADYPEYERVDNVQQATDPSATYPLNWLDAEATDGWIEFFNRGDSKVYVAVGDENVTAGYSDTRVNGGARERIKQNQSGQSIDPTRDTHFAIFTDVGSPQEVNARAEIGLGHYLVDAMSASGAASIEGGLLFANNEISDICNAIKGVPPLFGRSVFADNRVDRVYQDSMAAAPKVGVENSLRSYRNEFAIPFSRAGIPENMNGDARDPHGDMHQMYGASVEPGTDSIYDVISAGNTAIPNPLRPGVTSQGLFWSDNNWDPSYVDLASIGDIILGGSVNGINTGEDNGTDEYYPADGFLVYGATVLHHSDIDATSANIRMTMAEDGPAVVYSSIAGGIGGENVVFNDVLVADTGDEAWFADYAGLSGATDRSAVEAALTTSGEALGIGAVAARETGVIDWTTQDYDAVVDWSKIPSGVSWGDQTEQPTSTQVTLPLRRVLNRGTGLSVNPGTGVEWRAVDTDGSTEVQGWTSGTGTIDAGQWVQVRSTSPAAGGMTEDFSFTVNGFEEVVSITTAYELVDPFIMNGTYFESVEDVPANTSVMEFEAKVRFPTAFTDYVVPFAHTSSAFLSVKGNGAPRLSVEDSSGANVLPLTYLNDLPPVPSGEVLIFIFKIDWVNETVTFDMSGESQTVSFDSPAATDFVQTGRTIMLGSQTSSTAFLPADTEVEYFKTWLTTDGTRALHKEISVAAMGDIASINADPWANGTVLDANDVTAPTLSGSSFDDGTDTVSINSDEAGTLYWMVSDVAAPDAPTVKTGGGLASGSFPVSSGVNSEELDLSGVADGDHYLHLMVEDAVGNQAAVDSGLYTFTTPVVADDQALVVSGAVPAGMEAEVPAATLPVTVFGWVYCTTGNTNPTLWAGEAGRDQIWMSGANAETLNARTLSGTPITVSTGAGLNEWVPFRVTYRDTAPYVTVETPAGTQTGGGGASDEITALGTHWVGQDDGADANFPGRLFDVGVKAGEHTLAQLNHVDNAGTPNWTDFADSDPVAAYEYRLRGNGANPGTDSLGQNDFAQSAGGGSTTLDDANVPPGANV